MAGYVYLAWAKGTDMYKIGSSQYPEKRLTNLQTGSPVELEILTSQEFDEHEYQEKQLHRMWAASRIQGEWFRFSPMEVPRVVYSITRAFEPWTQGLLRDCIIGSIKEAIPESEQEVLASLIHQKMAVY